MHPRGFYGALIPVSRTSSSTENALDSSRRGPTTRATVFMLVVTVMMFCISTCAWVLRLVRARVVIRTNIVDAIKDIALAYPSIQDPLTNELDKLSSVSYFWDPVNPIWSHLGLGNVSPPLHSLLLLYYCQLTFLFVCALVSF